MIKKAVLIIVSFLLLFFSCKTTPSVKNAPEWVNSVHSVFPRSQYAAATGFGSTRAMAEGNALASLTAFFGQTVEVERTAASSYQQAIVNGVMDGWIDTAEMRANIRTTASMDNLMGAEIKEVWFDSKNTYYAVAVMEKARSAQIYRELLQVNLNVIKNLVTMTPNEKNSLDGVLRYRFAAIVADINVSYSNIIRLLDSPVPSGVTGGDQYRLEALNITKTIPINIRVTNDRNGRIYGAFARCFADWGFEATNANARYVLNVNTVMSPVDLPNNPNIFTRIEVSGTLTDTRANLVLLPYNFNSREGHTTQAESENRAIFAAERNVNEEFASILSEYFSQLLPKK